MVGEACVSFKVAKLLKEKVFNKKCRGGYYSAFDDNDNPIVILEEWIAKSYNNDFVDEGFLCTAPTHQMVIDWLREMHNLWIYIEPLTGYKWTWGIWFMNDPDHKMGESPQVISTYEEATESAIKYCLENLI